MLYQREGSRERGFSTLHPMSYNKDNGDAHDYFDRR